MLKVRNQTQQRMVAECVERATALFPRLKGLLGRDHLDDGKGLWIDNCNSIHTFFMRFPIDAIFLSEDRKVLRTYKNLKPQRLTRVVFGAKYVLELPAGTLDMRGVCLDDQLELEGEA